MWKIFKYSFYDMIRNRWMFFYMFFFLIVTLGFLVLNNDLTKVIVSLMNIILILTPLIGIMFGVMYFYGSKEFIELLLAKPISRKSIFSGMYLGLATSLCLSQVLGIAIPMILYGVLASESLAAFLILCGVSVILSIIFSLIAFLIALIFDNRIKGFGVAIFTWLFFALIYDGIFLLLLLFFKEYPLDKMSIGLTIFNPIDLSRILLLLKLDISTMMGFTGAVLQKFMGSMTGSVFIVGVLLLWIGVPFLLMNKIAVKKDF